MSSFDETDATTVGRRTVRRTKKKTPWLTATVTATTNYVPQLVNVKEENISDSGRQPIPSNVRVFDYRDMETDSDTSDAFASISSRATAASGANEKRNVRSRHPIHETFLHPLEVERLIPPFNGKDGSSTGWINKIEGYAIVYGWSARSCLHYAHSRLTGTARKWFDAQEEATLSWERFKTSICRAFPSRLNEADVHFQMAKRIRMKGEDEESYVYDM
ncbi:uncharacterized protein LOC131695082 [Topomyia yanbarensis]|uniref:uncharacterized protein LOC131695082 n=1 Tax=Topomyia yanbarensis TaxID=2498891 RepID=UPI00273C4DA9|nr:uncharacterized protein LOC131695082 [Topomyia yanbarensis]